jgi:hypothetical protein
VDLELSAAGRAGRVRGRNRKLLSQAQRLADSLVGWMISANERTQLTRWRLFVSARDDELLARTAAVAAIDREVRDLSSTPVTSELSSPDRCDIGVGLANERPVGSVAAARPRGGTPWVGTHCWIRTDTMQGKSRARAGRCRRYQFLRWCP